MVHFNGERLLGPYCIPLNPFWVAAAVMLASQAQRLAEASELARRKRC